MSKNVNVPDKAVVVVLTEKLAGELHQVVFAGKRPSKTLRNKLESALVDYAPQARVDL